GGLISLLLALTEGESWGWTSGRTLGLGAAALVFLVAWGYAELHVTEPMVDYGFDASATKAGLYLLPSSFALLFAGPIAGLIGRRTGFKWPLAAGMFLVSISAAGLAEWHDKPWQI